MGSIPRWKRFQSKPTSPRDILDYFGLGDEPPFPIVGVAKGLGIKVLYRPDADFESLLWTSEDQTEAKIIVDKGCSGGQNKFLVAYEIGQLLNNRGIRQHKTQKKDLVCRNEPEGLLDAMFPTRFPEKLLMPEWLVTFAISRCGIVEVSRLAHEFGVTSQIMETRLDQLGYF